MSTPGEQTVIDEYGFVFNPCSLHDIVLTLLHLEWPKLHKVLTLLHFESVEHYIALRMVKTPKSFGRSECNRVNLRRHDIKCKKKKKKKKKKTV